MSVEQANPETEQFTHPLQAQADYYYGTIWTGRHVADSQKTGGKFSALAPRSRWYQDINEPLVPVSPDSLLAPDDEFFGRLEQSLGWALKSTERAAQFVDSFRQAHTSPRDSTPLIESINNLQSQGKNIGLVVSHAFLMDVGYALAGLSVARGKTDYLAQNVTLLSKTLAYEAFDGSPVVELGESYTNSIFVSPRTATAKAINIPDDLTATVNAKGGRALKPFTDQGAVICVALAGAGVERIKDPTGQLNALRFPEMDYSSARLTEKLDYALPVSMWQDPETKAVSWIIGSLQKVPKPTAHLPADQRRLFNQLVADDYQLQLRRQLEQLSGLPTEYRQMANRAEVRQKGRLALRAMIQAA